MATMIRHREVSRLEGFSDSVFGFALTLLVVQLDTPMNLADLRNTVGSFLPFALTFAMVAWIWYLHNQFFRRYGLQDAWTIFLNCTLLFVVLFYVFPLKSLTLAIVGPLTMDRTTIPDIREMGHPIVMVIYSCGVILVFGSFLLLHLHAWRNRVALGLDERERAALRFGARGHMISTGLGFVSLLLVWLIPHQTAYAGVVYGMMGPLHGWNGYQAGKAQAALAAPIEHPLEHPPEHP
jgi:uncharacterized membrane protein